MRCKYSLFIGLAWCGVALAATPEAPTTKCRWAFRNVPRPNSIVLVRVDEPTQVLAPAKVLADVPAYEVPFSPLTDNLTVKIGGGGDERADQTIASLAPATALSFPVSNLDQSYAMGRPRVAGGPALIDVRDLPPDYAQKRLVQNEEPPKPADEKKDPLRLDMISRGQLTFKRSGDGTSITLYNGIFDANGNFVPAKNKIRVASEPPLNWDTVPSLRLRGNGAEPEQLSVELLPRAKPYYVLMPNDTVFELRVTAKGVSGAPVPPAPKPPAQATKPFEDRLQAAYKGALKPGQVVSLQSRPRFPDSPKGNHYVGAFHGFTVVDGKAYVVLEGADKHQYLYLAERIDFTKSTLGIDPNLIGPGPGNLLAKPKPKPVNPEVAPFNPKGNVEAQLAAYAGGFAHPTLGGAGWHDYAEAQRGVGRGGNVEGAKEIKMPNGTSAISKTYIAPLSDAKHIEMIIRGIRRMEVWASEGRGPRVYGVGYKVEGQRVRITMIMENMLPGKTTKSDQTIAGAEGYFITAQARNLPEPARVWLRDMLLLASSPTNHPDGHLLNVGYRIVHIRSDADLPSHGNYYRVGDHIVEVYAVDSAGGLAEQTLAAGNYLMAQYEPEKKKKYLNEQLGLR